MPPLRGGERIRQAGRCDKAIETKSSPGLDPSSQRLREERAQHGVELELSTELLLLNWSEVQIFQGDRRWWLLDVQREIIKIPKYTVEP